MFTARIIDANEAMAVFGLVRLCYPEIEVSAWRDHLSRLGVGKRKTAGCIVVTDQRGYCHAACLYRIAPDPRSGRRLEISYLSKAELPASKAQDVLLDFVDDLARREGCGHILIEDTDARIADRKIETWSGIDHDLASHHFRPESVGFVKVLPPLSCAS
jgi:hypothetical protein